MWLFSVISFSVKAPCRKLGFLSNVQSVSGWESYKLFSKLTKDMIEGIYKQKGEWLFTWSNSDGTRRNACKLKEGTFRSDVRKKVFTWRAQAAQRSCGGPTPGGVEGQVEWGPGQPGWMSTLPRVILRVPCNLSHSVIGHTFTNTLTTGPQPQLMGPRLSWTVRQGLV